MPNFRHPQVQVCNLEKAKCEIYRRKTGSGWAAGAECPDKQGTLKCLDGLLEKSGDRSSRSLPQAGFPQADVLKHYTQPIFFSLYCKV
ncbi:hypothetical protein [Thermoactinomyces mirandus]|uniref:hypothetical protein n=1 Tax=Thermoactinomyces mirandus TaxID=2756294 RepID=UPI001C69211F|nr:hypothetical protein [Thermoactinomyces mirandus]